MPIFIIQKLQPQQQPYTAIPLIHRIIPTSLNVYNLHLNFTKHQSSNSHTIYPQYSWPPPSPPTQNYCNPFLVRKIHCTISSYPHVNPKPPKCTLNLFNFSTSQFLFSLWNISTWIMKSKKTNHTNINITKYNIMKIQK